jgi:hypothetical protein
MVASCTHAPPATEPLAAPRHVLQNVSTGCYDVGDQKLVLVVEPITGPSYNENWIDRLGQYNDCSVTSLWDERFYRMAVPYWRQGLDVENIHLLLLGWRNITARTYGFVAVAHQSTYGGWEVIRQLAIGRTGDPAPKFEHEPLPEGGTVRTFWFVNGQRLAITVQNPVDGQGGNGPDDVLFKFGR